MGTLVVTGGRGSIAGPVVGAVGLELLSQFLRVNLGSYNQLIFGAIIVLVVVFFPQGVVNYFREAVKTRQFSILDNVRRYRLWSLPKRNPQPPSGESAISPSGSAGFGACPTPAFQVPRSRAP